MKQLSLAVANYHEVEGHYPPPYLTGENGRPMHSWRVLILPYIEADDIYKQYDFNEPWDGPNNSKLATRMPRLFAFSGDYQPGGTTSNYLAVVGPNTVWRPGKRVSDKDVKDGLASTIMIVENRGLNIHWMEPRDLDVETMDWSLGSPQGISTKYKEPAVATLDGAIRRLSPKIKPDVLRALVTIDGGEPISESPDGWDLIPDGRLREIADPQ